ncbi:MAG: tetratricopeptide repeat protein [Acidobacteriota bacterium]
MRYVGVRPESRRSSVSPVCNQWDAGKWNPQRYRIGAFLARHAAAGLAVLVLGAPAWSGVLSPPVLVVPPENLTGRAEYDWIGQSVARYLSHSLLPLLHVAAISSDARASGYDSIDIPETSAITRATLIRLATALRAPSALFGHYDLVEDGSLEVTVYPFDVERMSLGRGIAVKGKLEELISIENTIGFSLVSDYFVDPDHLKAQILGRDAQTPIEAYEYFVKSFGQSDPEKRQRYLLKAVSLYPHYDEAILEEARILYLRRDYVGVVRLLGNSSAAFADRFAYVKGMAYYSQSSYADAAAAFKTLVGKSGLGDAALNNYAASCSELGRQDEASFYLRGAIQQASSQAILRYNLGIVYKRAGRTDEAMAALKEAARIDPGDWDAQVLLADLLAQQGLKEEAEAVRALADKRSHADPPPEMPSEPKALFRCRLLPLPDEPDSRPVSLPSSAPREDVVSFHLARGSEYCKREMWVEASEELRKVLYLNPYLGQARYLLATAYMGLGDLEHALVEAKMSLWSNESADAHALAAHILKRMGRAGEARAEAEKALQLDPAQSEALELLDVPQGGGK